MKKVLYSALIALPVFFSCNKGDSPAILETPAKADAALVVNTTSHPVLTIKDEEVNVQKIEFFRTGRYLITATVTEVKAEDATVTVHFSGSFSESNGTYSCSGDFVGTIAISTSQSQKTVSFNGNDPTPITTTPVEVPGGTFEDFLYRTWTIEEIDIALTKPQVRQGITCSNNENVKKIIDVANQYGASIDDKYKAYNVKEITLNPNSFMVSFTNGTTFGGEIKNLIKKSTDGATFNYEFVEQLESNVIARNASGTIKQDGKKLVVSVSVSTSQIVGTVDIICNSVN